MWCVQQKQYFSHSSFRTSVFSVIWDFVHLYVLPGTEVEGRHSNLAFYSYTVCQRRLQKT